MNEPLSLPEIPKLKQKTGEKLDLPSVPVIGAPQTPPRTSTTNWQDIGVGLAGAPAMAGAMIAGTPRDIHDLRRNMVPTPVAEQKQGLDYIASGNAPNVDPNIQSQLKSLSNLSQPAIPKLWHKYVSPFLFGEESQDESGRVTTSGGIMPSTQGTYEAIPEALKTQPKTPEGKKAQEYTATGIAGAATLPLEGAGVVNWVKGLVPWAAKNVARTGIITGGEYGGEEIKDWMLSDPTRTGGKDLAPFVQPATTLATQILAHKALPSSGIATRSERDVAAMVRQDREKLLSNLNEHDLDYIGTSSGLTHDQVKEAIRAGVPLKALNIGGEDVRSYLSHASELSEDAKRALISYNEKVQPPKGQIPLSAVNSQGRVKSFFQDMAGDIPFDDALKARTASNKAEVGRIYDETMDAPNAESVTVPVEISNNAAVRQARKEVESDINLWKNQYGYEGRDIIPPKSEGEPFTVFDERTGRMVTTRTPASNGNLAYWDMVKKRLYDIESGAEKGSPENAGANFARRQLTDHLDNEVEGYKGARDEHIESIGQLNAAKVGREFGTKAGTKALDKIDDETGLSHRTILRDTFNKMNNEQKDIAIQGVYESLSNRMNTPAGVSKLANDLLVTNLGDDLRFILGDDEYHLMRGKVLGESMVANAPPINISNRTVGPVASSSKPALVGAALAVAERVGEVFMTQPFLPEHLQGLGLIAGGVGSFLSGKKYLNALEARALAERITPILLSNDPKVIMRISRLAEKDPVFHRMVQSLATPTRFAITQQNPPEQERFLGGRTRRATGGKVASSAKQTAMRLVALAESMKKQHNETTKPLLDVDDNTITKALAVANKGI